MICNIQQPNDHCLHGKPHVSLECTTKECYEVVGHDVRCRCLTKKEMKSIEGK